jgi:hypothetical protein
LGGDEQLVSVDKNGNISFSHLNSLYQVQGSDLLAMSLYLNSDPSNVLWDVGIAPIYVQKVDPDYPDVTLRWDDYYPALGKKTITVLSDLPVKDLANRQVKAEILHAPNGAAFAVTGKDQTTATTSFTKSKTGQYEALFQLAPPSSLPALPDSDNKVTIRFTLLPEAGNNQSQSATIQADWTVRTNQNTDLADVLNGKAVFVEDNALTISFPGKSDDTVKHVDYVQADREKMGHPLLLTCESFFR